MEVTVHAGAEQLGEAAAEQACRALHAAIDARGEATVVLATGTSQRHFHPALVRQDLPWAKVRVLHMDEYVGIGADHPASFAGWIQRAVVDQVHPGHWHPIDGLAETRAETARYALLLAAHPVDLCVLGIGENGHLAFNDPAVADLDDPVDVKEVELDDACRAQQVGEGHFASVEEMPRTAITLTIPALLRAGTVIGVVPELRKAAAVHDAVRGPVGPACPASALQTCDHATLHLDRDSASLL